MIALDLNVAAFYSAAGAAQFLQARGELLKLLIPERQAADHRYRLTAAPGYLAADAHARALGRCSGGRHT